MTTTVNIKAKKPNLNWKKQILPEIQKQEAVHKTQGIPATIRGLLYIFESKGLLQKNKYGSLSKHLVKWREQEKIDSDWIIDKSRRIIDIIEYDQKGSRILVEYDDKIQTSDELINPSEHVKCGIDYLRDVPKDFLEHIPRWLGQPKYVEVWVEKSAMGSVVHSILYEVKVIVVPNGGWSSYTFAKDNLDRLLEQQKTGKEIYIQYYGDSDPSGERMSAKDSKMVKLLEKHGIHFERIAITDKTIKDFEMEQIKIASLNDPVTQRKFRGTEDKLGDPNYRWFAKRHRGQAWQIEVDALQLDLEKFKELVLSNIKKHFDEKIHEEIVKDVQDEYSVDKINEELKEQLRDLCTELGLNCY